MTDEVPFDRVFDAVPGKMDEVISGVRRILAPNPGPFTFTGTCSYVIGKGTVAILDPGPADSGHIAALLEAIRGETVAQIVVTHTHRDHSTSVPAIQKATGAKTYGEGPHRAARPLHAGEVNPVEAGADHDFSPDVQIKEGQLIEGPSYALEVIPTPGHTANHLAFALRGSNAIFSGDHVMAWSTSVVAPPDGSMTDYMASLEKLRARSETVYLPGHGPLVRNAHAFVDRYIAHRRAREDAILRRLERGAFDIPNLVKAIYIGLDQRLSRAASLTTLAHLEDLVGRGLVKTDGPPTLTETYRLK